MKWRRRNEVLSQKTFLRYFMNIKIRITAVNYGANDTSMLASLDIYIVDGDDNYLKNKGALMLVH